MKALRKWLIPTTTREYKQLQDEYRDTYTQELCGMDSDLQKLKELNNVLYKKRTSKIRCFQLVPPQDAEEHSAWLVELDRYLDDVKRKRELRSHVLELEEDKSKFNELVNTQATADLVRYRGLRDWARSILPAVSYLSNALMALSTVGAGLVYATIFNAGRGNIGLMCFTFPLFTVGFLVPAVIRVILGWASQLQHEVTFASQPFWNVVITVFMLFAAISVMVAMTVLNITIFFLDPAALAHDKTGNSSDISGVGAISRLPGIIAFAFSGLIFVFLSVAFVLCAIVRRSKKDSDQDPSEGRNPLHNYLYV